MECLFKQGKYVGCYQEELTILSLVATLWFMPNIAMHDKE